jgi:hypothetical protein
MVPFTIFQRLSSLGSGGGVNAGTIPSKNAAETLDRGVRGCLALLYEHRLGKGRDIHHVEWDLSQTAARICGSAIKGEIAGASFVCAVRASFCRRGVFCAWNLPQRRLSAAGSDL